TVEKVLAQPGGPAWPKFERRSPGFVRRRVEAPAGTGLFRWYSHSDRGASRVRGGKRCAQLAAARSDGPPSAGIVLARQGQVERGNRRDSGHSPVHGKESLEGDLRQAGRREPPRGVDARVAAVAKGGRWLLLI